MYTERAHDAAKIIQNTFISAAFSGVVAAILKPCVLGQCSQPFAKYDARALCNGVITGLVAISGACDRCEPWAAVLIGSFAGIFYAIGCKIL
jgi:Amt family ammonium transporter